MNLKEEKIKKIYSIKLQIKSLAEDIKKKKILLSELKLNLINTNKKLKELLK